MAKSKKPAKIAFKNKGEELAAQEATRLQSYVVVQKADARRAKYAHTPGEEGFSLESAQLKAIQVHPEQPDYGIITVGEYEFIQNEDAAITTQQAVNKFAAQNPVAVEVE